MHRLRGLLSEGINVMESLIGRSSSTPSSKDILIDNIIRVDHAGELAADRIYAGQMSILSKSSTGPLINKMWEEEKNHLDEMERLSATHNVRPSILSPIFSLSGYTLGALSALAGKEGAMGCTMAVEELIGTHYNNQIKDLLEVAPEEKKLLETLSRLRDEELHHFEVGKDNEGEKSPMFSPLKIVVQSGCKVAMKIAEKI